MRFSARVFNSPTEPPDLSSLAVRESERFDEVTAFHELGHAMLGIPTFLGTATRPPRYCAKRPNGSIFGMLPPSLGIITFDFRYTTAH